MSIWGTIASLGSKIIKPVLKVGTKLLSGANSSTGTGLINNALNLGTTYALTKAGINQGIQANKDAQERQFQYEKQLQLQQQEWLENMSSSAHQREIQDLNKAGLNPILSTGGTGATTPSSGMGNVGLTDDGQQILGAISSALQAKQLQQQQQLIDAQVRNYDAQTENTNLAAIKQGIEVERWPEKFDKEIDNLKAQIYYNRLTASASQTQADAAKSKAKTAMEGILLEKELQKYKKDLMQSETDYNNRRSGGQNIYDLSTWMDLLERINPKGGNPYRR